MPDPVRSPKDVLELCVHAAPDRWQGYEDWKTYQESARNTIRSALFRQESPDAE